MSEWNAIDYENPETWPIESKPCLVAWDAATVRAAGWGKDAMTNDGLNMRVPSDEWEWLWADCYSGDFEQWADDCKPTHWCYAPQFGE